MTDSFEKIINLIKRTGDNCIVLDSSGQPAYVVMGFNRYQSMIEGQSNITELSKDEFLDKINHDIALWKSSTDEQNLDNISAIEAAMEEAKKSEADSEDDPFSTKNSLNQAKNKSESQDLEKDSEEKYYFEPID